MRLFGQAPRPRSVGNNRGAHDQRAAGDLLRCERLVAEGPPQSGCENRLHGVDEGGAGGAGAGLTVGLTHQATGGGDEPEIQNELGVGQLFREWLVHDRGCQACQRGHDRDLTGDQVQGVDVPGNALQQDNPEGEGHGAGDGQQVACEHVGVESLAQHERQAQAGGQDRRRCAGADQWLARGGVGVAQHVQQQRHTGHQHGDQASAEGGVRRGGVLQAHGLQGESHE